MAGSKGEVRRSRFLVTYWRDDAHELYNYLTRTSRTCTPLILAILDATAAWSSRDEIRESASGWSRREVDSTIADLLRDGTLEATDRPPLIGEEALDGWEHWNPAAGFYHAVSQSAVPRPGEDADTLHMFVREFPATLKRHRGRRHDLPACAEIGQFGEVLRRRRTWREFDGRKLTQREAATLLGLTFRVDRWMKIGRGHRVALKSSPSGGARHSIEAYLLAFGVEGVPNGTYHYDPDGHALTRIGARKPRRALLSRLLPTQDWFHDAAAIVVMTSVFERVQYKYPHPHAYRVVMLDAGHLGQTFALAATALELAPFCTASFDASAIEKHLGVDGISEAPVLVLGVGARPAGKRWSPMSDRTTPSRTEPPQWAARLPHALPRFP